MRMSVELRLADHSTEELCSLIEQGMSRATIAAKWGFTRSQIQGWIEANPVRQERERQARLAAGEWCADEAERVLRAIPKNGTVAEVAQARELAQHLRWKASKMNPGTWGDKLTVSHKIETDPNAMTDAQLAAIAAGGGQVIDGEAEQVPEGEGPDAAPAHRDMHTRNQALA